MQIVEEEGVVLSDSQEVNEVEEIAMGDDIEVREEEPVEVERDLRPIARDRDLRIQVQRNQRER